MKIARYKRLSSLHIGSWISILPADLDLPGYIRISEIVDVEFPPRADDGAIIEESKKLDAAIEAIKVEATSRIGELQQRKSELLALTHEETL